ncbi:MAG: hypothetical protein A2Y73_03505 [Chloroflexi bacterium RBG_13_56_8]|nr:MAG: hypothetical protein A2Y73_03505 [Chloroflexi bacterium RBG_13_56_8]
MDRQLIRQVVEIEQQAKTIRDAAEKEAQDLIEKARAKAEKEAQQLIADAQAEEERARITFVYVVDTSVVEELTDASGGVAKQVRGELERTGQRYLNHLARLATNADLEVNQVIRYGKPYSEIESLALEEHVDLIVIGQVGQRGPRRILIGSVTERVIEYAPCPVLIVK